MYVKKWLYTNRRCPENKRSLAKSCSDGFNLNLYPRLMFTGILYTLPMTKYSDLLQKRNSVSCLYVHLVFVSKYRKRVFNRAILESMQNIFEDVCRENQVKLVEFDGESDHVHLLVQYPPSLCIGTIVQRLKGRASNRLRKQYPQLRKSYWGGSMWMPSYFAASCGGAPVAVVRQYIENQATPA